MVINRKILARKYARAFLNLYFDALSNKNIHAFTQLQAALKENPGILCFLSIPSLSEQTRQIFLSELCANFDLPDYCIQLIETLAKKNIDIFAAVFKNIIQEFWQRKHVLHFEITSSHLLLAEEQSAVIDFLVHKTGAASIKAIFLIDSLLICGIKMRSDEYIFEHSVARELKKIEQLLLQRVQL